MNETIAFVILALLLVNLLGLVVVGLRGNGHHDMRHFERRLMELEARVNNLPTHSHLDDLRTGLNGVKEKAAEISGQMTAIAGLLRTIQEHLLEND
ncbi:DUF2730 family protein [Frateuria sp. YIM B11624]|uniref:DUF2730 family protein n=1 Tax=Frateuria sp. YIM B11624 TaxID=3143185 RepID=UPI003C787C3C